MRHINHVPHYPWNFRCLEYPCTELIGIYLLLPSFPFFFIFLVWKGQDSHEESQNEAGPFLKGKFVPVTNALSFQFGKMVFLAVQQVGYCSPSQGQAQTPAQEGLHRWTTRAALTMALDVHLALSSKPLDTTLFSFSISNWERTVKVSWDVSQNSVTATGRVAAFSSSNHERILILFRHLGPRKLVSLDHNRQLRCFSLASWKMSFEAPVYHSE